MIETESLSGNLNNSQSITDQIFDKGSLRKRKFSSISGNQQNIKGKNVIDEDPINFGTNSMGHPVTKRMIETESLSGNLNVSKSITDQIFGKGLLRKQKSKSISGNQQKIKGKNVIDGDPIDV